MNFYLFSISVSFFCEKGKRNNGRYLGLGTNAFLFRIGATESDLCSFCSEEPENLLHLFWQCRVSNSFWSAVDTWITDSCQISLDLHCMDIIFGKFHKPKIINSLLCLGKLHLYRQKMSGILPCLQLFKRQIQEYYVTEEYLYASKNEQQNFYRRWAPIHSCL